jgi:hypothetical protein
MGVLLYNAFVTYEKKSNNNYMQNLISFSYFTPKCCATEETIVFWALKTF